MAFLDEVAEYARIETTEAQTFIDAAETYLTNAGVVKDEANSVYALAVKMLVTFWYDNRIPSGTVDAIPFGLSGLIAQLKYCVSEEVTT